MFRNFAFGLVFMGIAVGAARADSELLWQHSAGGSFGICPGSIPPPEDRWVEFTLEWGPLVVFGEGLQWYPPQAPGEYIWSAANTPLEEWVRFVAYLTNGSCDPWSRCWGSIIGGQCESQVCDVDLSGYRIHYLRLSVEEINWDENYCVTVSCAGTWEIWGSEDVDYVPTVSTWGLLALALLLLVGLKVYFGRALREKSGRDSFSRKTSC